MKILKGISIKNELLKKLKLIKILIFTSISTMLQHGFWLDMKMKGPTFSSMLLSSLAPTSKTSIEHHNEEENCGFMLRDFKCVGHWGQRTKKGWGP